MTVLVLCAMFFAGLQAKQAPSNAYLQTYAIFLRGAPAGTETVNEQTDKDGNRICTSKHEIQIVEDNETKMMAFETTMAFVKNTAAFSSYSYRYQSGSQDTCEVAVRDGKISRTLSRGGNISEASVDQQPSSVLVDVNVYYQYDALSRIYDFKKRGRQTFNNFLPVIAAYVPISVTWIDDSKLDFDKGPIPVRNFKVELLGTRTGTFTTDMNGRLIRLVIPGQELEVIRKDLVPPGIIK